MRERTAPRKIARRARVKKRTRERAAEVVAARLERALLLEPIPAPPRFPLLGLASFVLAFFLPATCSTVLALNLWAALPGAPQPRLARVAPAPAPVVVAPSAPSAVDELIVP